MSDRPEVEAAKAVMEAHLAALNAQDEAGLAATMHFPHYRLSEGKLKVWEGPETYLAGFRERAGKSWGYTEWGELIPLQSGPDKVHFGVRVDRFRSDGSLLSSFHSLWVVTQLDGKWAAQLRSSFAEDAELGLRS
jgi:hypothetical protein